MRQIIRLWTSRKLWSMLIAVAVLWGIHERATNLLWSFWMPEQISSFTTLTLATLTAIAAVVTAYMGIQGFATSTISSTLSAGIQAVSSRTGTGEDIIKLYNLAKLDPKDIPNADEV